MNNLFKSKLKILFNSEASYSTSGYGQYYYNLISRMHKTNKYRIAEFGSFGEINNPLDHIIKWRYYPNQVNDQDPRYAQYNSNDSNKLGYWRFEKVLLDFMPDIVIDVRDSTMMEYETLTSLRKYFHHIISPSIDSAPQINSWLSLMLQADCIMGYTDYAKDVIAKECGGKAKFYKTAYPASDYSIFKPLKNKREIRQQLGLPVDANIVGFCARNQIRKLIPSLMAAFAKYLNTITNPTQKSNTFLYLHTTYPDLKPWRLEKLLIQYGLTNNVLFTYICTKCNKYYCSKYQDILTSCRFCGNQAIMPRMNVMPNQHQLNEIYNLFDVYIQYASCEGAGIPLIEAAGAGCPVMAIDYSGCGDIVRRLGGVPIKYHSLLRDINVDADRAVPDEGHLVEELIRFFNRPTALNLRNGFKIHENCKKKFNWDANAEIYMEYIDNYKPTDFQGRWFYDDNYAPRPIPDNSNNALHINNLLNNGLQESHLKNSLFIDESIKMSEIGLRQTGNSVIPYSKNELINSINNLINQKIEVNKIRTGKAQLPNEDFLNYAEAKELSNL